MRCATVSIALSSIAASGPLLGQMESVRSQTNREILKPVNNILSCSRRKSQKHEKKNDEHNI